MGALDAPVQGASFYVEKIKLASKLRELYYGVGVGHFQAKSPLTNFQTLAGLNTCYSVPSGLYTCHKVSTLANPFRRLGMSPFVP